MGTGLRAIRQDISPTQDDSAPIGMHPVKNTQRPGRKRRRKMHQGDAKALATGMAHRQGTRNNGYQPSQKAEGSLNTHGINQSVNHTATMTERFASRMTKWCHFE